MKKLLIILICTALCVSLNACRIEKPNDTTGSIAADTTASATVPVIAPETTTGVTESSDIRLPMIAVSMPLKTEHTMSGNKTSLFSNMYQDVALIAPDQDTVDTIIMNILHLIDAGQETALEIKAAAQELYDPEQPWTPYFYKHLYSPARLDEKVLSLFGYNAVFTGGVHPVQTNFSATFDMATGKQLTLKDIVPDAKAATAISKLLIEDLNKHAKEYQLYDGYADIVSQRLSGNGVKWESAASWYLSDRGLCFYFSPYDLAPYVAGTIEAVIPYENLTGLIVKDYFPAVLPNAGGKMYASLAQDVDLSQFSQFAEATLEANGERVVLYPDGLVTNIRLEELQMIENGYTLYPVATVFAANTLCEGDAIMLKEYFPDGIPGLRLSYQSNGATHQFDLSQSGKDGSIILTPTK